LLRWFGRYARQFESRGRINIELFDGTVDNTRSVIDALKSGQLGYLGIDVYEQEENLFFHDFSESVIQDDVILRLMSFPNVLVTAHQAFFTEEALSQIAQITLQNIRDFEEGKTLKNAV
jgi:D-lactate dehydrogenase